MFLTVSPGSTGVVPVLPDVTSHTLTDLSLIESGSSTVSECVSAFEGV